MAEPKQPTPHTLDVRDMLLLRAVSSAVALLPGATSGPIPPDEPDPATFVRSVLDRTSEQAGPEGFLAELGPRYRGRGLLESSHPHAQAALRALVQWEVEGALELAKALPSLRLTRWVVGRLCGPMPLPESHRRAFFGLVADVLREIREVEAERTSGKGPRGHTTLAELTQGAAIDTVAIQESEEAAGVARVSRKLETRFPDLGEVFLLRCYAGLPPDEVATLLQRPVTEVEDQYAVATDWMLAQSVLR